MRRVRFLLCALTLLVAAAAPASATSVTVVLTGTWFAVDDTANVFDNSIDTGGSFSLTLVYDDAAVDQDGSADFGAYFTAAASSDLSVATGNYTFSPGSGVGVGVENDAFNGDWTYLNATSYSVSGPGGVGTGTTAYLDASLNDSNGSAHGSDDLIGLNWSFAAFDASDVYLFVEITGAGPGQYLELQGTIGSISVLPEPSAILLLGLACAGLAAPRVRV